MSKRYAVVTAVQISRHKYVISEDRLQGLNMNSQVKLSWAEDTVSCQVLEEFSRSHLSESIVESEWKTEKEVLSMFSDNILADLSDEEKINYINYGLKLDNSNRS